VKNRILIVMPTRGRPWAALEAIASVMKHSTGLADLIYCCDHDDPTFFRLEKEHVRCWYAPRRSFAQWVNMVVAKHLTDYEWFAWCADDIRYLTPGWDQKVVAHPELVVYGPDGIQNEKMATHPFIRAALPAAFGWLTPPELKHGCMDVFVESVGRHLGRLAYDPEIKLEHLHHSVGRSAYDLTYQEVDWERDLTLWYEKIKPEIAAYAAQVGS